MYRPQRAISLILCLMACTSAYCLEVTDVVFPIRDNGTVTFSHNKHLQTPAIGDNCNICHEHFFRTKRTRPITMAEMGRGKSCGGCHNGRRAFPLSDCGKCHPTRDLTFRIKGGDRALFSHTPHTARFRCTDCHTRIYGYGRSQRPVSMDEMGRGRSCGACHGQSAFSLFSCSRCHQKSYDASYRVVPTGPVTFSHGPHAKLPGCGACHPDLFKKGKNRPSSMMEMEKGRSCGACHTGRRAFDLNDCSRCHMAEKIVMKVKGSTPVTFPHAPHTAKYGCTDCHPRLFRLGYVKQRGITMEQMDQGKSCGACHDDTTAFNTRFNCHRCHDM